MMHAKDYENGNGAPYEPIDHRSFLSIRVLEFLNGRPWDDLALNLVHSLRPSSIRVTTGEVKCDARTWRVTVYVSKDNIIQKIRQEVEVGLLGDLKNGSDLDGKFLDRGVDL